MVVLWDKAYLTMNQDKYVFAQLTQFLDNNKFFRIVRKYDGDKGRRELSCWNQMLLMLFGQLSHRDSLRDLMVAVEAHRNKAYHLGFGINIHRTTLLRANERRDYRIFEEFATQMIGIARRKNALVDFPVDVPGEVYAFDSSIVDVCLRLFRWATYKRDSGAVKLHTLYDVKTHIPCMVHVTAASVHDVRAMDEIEYEKHGFYIFDRGYNDFERLHRINLLEAFSLFGHGITCASSECIQPKQTARPE
jgi:hypothetical protein